MRKIENTRVRGVRPLVSPETLHQEFPLSEHGAEIVAQSRDAFSDILHGRDKRFAVIVGPCSIHNEDLAVEYAQRLQKLASKYSDRLFIIMRVYFEKPRTTVGWKGLINDPHMNDSFDIGEGLRIARRLLSTINQLGLPIGTEMLEPITPQYIADLVTWSSIGARTTESPTHRQMASGLSMPVGFKNATDGSVDIAVNGMVSARAPHSFLGIDATGATCIIDTAGNEDCHLILRGGRSGPNYDTDSVAEAAGALRKCNVEPGILVDCSHGNSQKDHNRQEAVLKDVVSQFNTGASAIVGAMLESNIHEGNQKLGDDPAKLEYGVSITDACIGWEKTEELLAWAYEELGAVAAV